MGSSPTSESSTDSTKPASTLTRQAIDALPALSLTRLRHDADARFNAIVLVLATVAFLVFVRVLYPAPLPIIFLGIVLGSLSALVAMGLVLVYRANRIINFAQGDMGALAAVLAASLIVGPKWPFFPAVAVGFAAALGLGAVTQIVFIRRFAKAPRLILTVATIGLLQLFAFGELALPSLFNFDRTPQPPVPFDFTFEWFPVTFRSGHLLILIVVPIVGAALTAFFKFTRIGIAVRASAESSDRAAQLGIPVKRIETLVWVIAAGLSGLGVMLRLPIQGVSIGAVLGPSLLLRALAAAVIGRMENLGVTFGAALALGVIEQSVLFVSGRTIIVDGVLFFVILAALLAQRRGKNVARAEDAGASTWSATREVRPIPRELWALPVVRNSVIGGGIGLGALLLLVPLTLEAPTVNLLGVGLLFSLIIVSLGILTGWAGQISLGQLAFMAFGAAVAGTLAQQGKHFFVAILAAGITGAGVAMVVGVPALRIRGPFLAVTTLAFALTTGTFFLNDEFFPWLVPDPGVRIARPILFDKFDLESEHANYYAVLALFAFTLAAFRSLRNSRTGRALVATRDNRRAAQAYGVNPTNAQLTAFAISGFVAAAAGGLYVFHQHDMTRTILETERNIQIFSMSVIGGLGSIPGALLGAGYLTFVDFSPFTRRTLARLFASGLGLLLILLVLPGGLGGLFYDLRDAILRRVARWKGIVVPSLLADVRVLEEGSSDLVASSDATRPMPAAPSDAPEDALLTVSGLDVSYGRTQVLFGVNFHVNRGEIVALLGTNGAGKSTLLGSIAGLIGSSSGRVDFDGQDITKDDASQTVAKGIVLMPGGKAVFPTLTVEENLRLAAWLYEKDEEYVRTTTERVLQTFPVLRERWRERAGNMSGGEQQMLGLGQALIAKPKILMIDELSLGLAPVIVERLLEIVRALHAEGTTVVLVEQSVNVAITLAERAVFMEKGEVRFDGPTQDLLDRPDILRAVFLKGTAAATGGATTKSRNGHQAFQPHCEVCGREHPVVLECHELAVSFGGVSAVIDVSLQARESQIVGIIGPNGAGKTTVFDMLSGYLVPDRGRIVLAGQDVTPLSPDARATLGLGRSFQDARLFPSMTVRQTVAVALDRHTPIRDPIAAALVSPAVRLSERVVDAEVERLIELMNLNAFADKFVGELSTGTRRIVDLACALAHDPKVLLLDEPSSGLAQRETEALGPVLLDLRDKTQAAVIIIEHDMPLITSISDELVALDLGAVVARGAPDDVINHPAVVEGYLGGSEDVIMRSGRRSSARSGRKKAAARTRSTGRASRTTKASKTTKASTPRSGSTAKTTRSRSAGAKSSGRKKPEA